MRFLNPEGLWLLLGIPVLIIIYLIKSRHEDRAVSSTYLWKLSSKFMKKRMPLQRIKKILIFILQLLVILGLALIAARPATENGDSCNYIAIIDASASMQTKDEGGTSRFDYAKEQVEELTEEIGEGHSVSVILAADTATYLIQGSTSAHEVRLALSNAVCGNTGCDTAEAVSLAQLLCDRSSKAEVMFFTDSEYSETNNITVIDLNQDEWNVSVESLSSKSDLTDTVFTGTLTSYNRDAVVNVGLKIDGILVDAQVINCLKDEKTKVSFTSEGLTSFDSAEIFIEDNDGLAADNSYAVCKKNSKTYSVTLVSTSPLYLETALNALGNCEVQVASTIDEAVLTGQDLYIFDGITPDVYPSDGSILQFGTKKLPAGLTVKDSNEKEAALTVNNKIQSEVLDDLVFSETVVSKYDALVLGSNWTPLLYCDGNPVMATKEIEGDLHFSVISFDLHNSNLPMQSEFVILLKNLVEYSVPGLLKSTDYSAGETVHLSVLPMAEEMYVEAPDGSVRVLSTAGKTASVTADQVGIYTAVMTTTDGGEYADFFVHIPKSEIVSVPGGTLKIDMTKEEDADTDTAFSEWWFWIALAVLVIVLGEWGWYYREQY